MPELIIRTGGQTGVDRAALDLAIRQNRPYAGWCPKGGWAEDLREAPGLLARYPHLTETPTAMLEQRSAWNVRDSHATIILIRDQAELSAPGVSFTWMSAELIFVKPCHVVNLHDADVVTPARAWLQRNIALVSDEKFILNVAGARESLAPGIYLQATAFLNQLLA